MDKVNKVKQIGSGESYGIIRKGITGRIISSSGANFNDKLCYKYIDHKFFKSYVDSTDRQKNDFCKNRIQIEKRIKEFIQELPPPQIDKKLWDLLWNDKEIKTDVVWGIKPGDFELDHDNSITTIKKVNAGTIDSNVIGSKDITARLYNMRVKDETGKIIKEGDRVVFSEKLLYSDLVTANHKGVSIKGEIISCNVTLLKQIDTGEEVEDDACCDFKKYDRVKVTLSKIVDNKVTDIKEKKGKIVGPSAADWANLSHKNKYLEVLYDGEAAASKVEIEYDTEYTKLTGREVAEELRSMSDKHYDNESKSCCRIFKVLVGEMEDPDNAINSMVCSQPPSLSLNQFN